MAAAASCPSAWRGLSLYVLSAASTATQQVRCIELGPLCLELAHTCGGCAMTRAHLAPPAAPCCLAQISDRLSAQTLSHETNPSGLPARYMRARVVIFATAFVIMRT